MQLFGAFYYLKLFETYVSTVYFNSGLKYLNSSDISIRTHTHEENKRTQEEEGKSNPKQNKTK